MTLRLRIRPCLWFDTEAEAAAELYVSVFPNSKITSPSRYDESGPGKAGTVRTVEFVLDGLEFMAINGGPRFPHTEAISFQIDCADASEVDHYWDRLGEGGEYGRCGWLKDRFGVSWQVIPAGLGQLLGDPDPARAARANKAMLSMRKLDLDAMRSAAD
jgi:predicted 3-demethylubiquinone-9 3-methyltransferase (glyoxalase superfamily)